MRAHPALGTRARYHQGVQGFDEAAQRHPVGRRTHKDGSAAEPQFAQWADGDARRRA